MVDRSELENAVRAFYNARNRNDLDAMIALLDPDCSFRIAGSNQLGPITQLVQGEESLRAAMDALVDDWDLSELHIISLHVDDNTAFIHRAGKVCFVPSGAVIETELLDRLTFSESGLITDYLEFIDTHLVADTAGLLSPQEAIPFAPETISESRLQL
jgi:ketosteroid isomerase-like protein